MKKNVVISLIDYKKPYDLVSCSWINKNLNATDVAVSIQDIVTNSMENWRTLLSNNAKDFKPIFLISFWVYELEYALSKIFPAVFSGNCILSYKKLSFSLSNKVSSRLILNLRERFPSGCLLHEPLGLSCSVLIENDFIFIS